MSRVFVLGSGFSVGAGAPLSRSILGSIFRADVSASHVLELKSYIDHFLFPGRPHWVTEADFEEVLSRLDLIRHYQPYPNIDYGQVSYYEDLLIAEFAKLLDPAHLSPMHRTYDVFKKLLKPEDVVISFNYDLVMESLLESTALGLDYCLEESRRNIPQKAKLRLLKLHGSINLLYCPRCSGVYSDHLRICKRCSTPDKVVSLRQFIIAPTLFKSFTLPALRRLWFTALQALAGASRLYIIGYSLPKADILSHQLFDFAWRMSRQNHEIHLINGPKAAPERFLNIYGGSLKNEGVYFERWVEQLVNC